MTRREIFFLSGTLLFLDQLLKYLSSAIYLNINFAWSLPLSNFVSAILMISLLVGLIIFYSKSNAAILIFAGAVSNLIDRLARGGVVDYLWLPYGAVINLADMMILAGLVWWLLAARRNTHAG